METIEFFENRCCVCHVVFAQKRRGRLRRTCSDACRQALYRLRHEKPKEEKPENSMPVCVVCGEPIEMPETGGMRKTCSAACRNKLWQIGAVKPNREDICPVCGGPMVQPARGRKRKTCSERCRKKLWRQQTPRCVICGKRFKPKHLKKDIKYCSGDCKQQALIDRRRRLKIERETAKLAGTIARQMPRPGSGYREEIIPWEEDQEEPVVVWERKPEPNYEREIDEFAWEREQAAYIAEQMEETKREIEKAKKARALAQELLGDNRKWW